MELTYTQQLHASEAMQFTHKKPEGMNDQIRPHLHPEGFFRYETDIHVYSARCEWIIRNWRHAVKEGSNHHLESPIFHALELPDVNWHLRLWPNRRYSAGQNPQMDIAVFTNRNEAIHSTEMVCSMWSMSPGDKERIPLGVIKRMDYWGLSSRICGKPEDIVGRDLIVECTMRYALKSNGPNANLSRMETYDDAKLQRIGRSRKEMQEQFQTLDSYEHLLHDKDFSDITLVLKDEFSWFAHRAILAQRSPVFRAMFTNPMWEKGKTTIELIEDEDIDLSTWKEFMHFVYSGSTPNLDVHCWSLLKLADKYEITGLKSLSTLAITEQLENHSIPHALVLAFLHNADELHDACLRFIRGSAPAVYATPEWRQLMVEWPDVAVEALTATSPPIQVTKEDRPSNDVDNNNQQLEEN